MPEDPAKPSPNPPGPAANPTKAAAPAPTRDIGRSIKTALYVGVAVLTTVFLMFNSQTVTVDFVFTTVEAPLYVVIAVSLVLGAILAVGAMGIRSHRKSKVR